MKNVAAAMASFVICFGALAASVLLASPSQAPRAGDTVLVVSPPWRAAETVAISAGGVVVAKGVVPFIAAAYAPEADFAAELRRSGALFAFRSLVGEAILCR